MQAGDSRSCSEIRPRQLKAGRFRDLVNTWFLFLLTNNCLDSKVNFPSVIKLIFPKKKKKSKWEIYHNHMSVLRYWKVARPLWCHCCQSPPSLTKFLERNQILSMFCWFGKMCSSQGRVQSFKITEVQPEPKPSSQNTIPLSLKNNLNPCCTKSKPY